MRSNLPDVHGGRQGQPQQFFQHLEHYKGPLPHPKILADFEALVPGSAQRILDNFHTESDHRRAMEKDESEAARGFFSRELDYRRRGQTLGFAITVMAFAAAGVAFWKGQPVAGSIVSSGSLVALVALFVTGKRGRQKQEPSPT